MSQLVVLASRPVEQFLSMLKSQHVEAILLLVGICLCCLPLLDVELVWLAYGRMFNVHILLKSDNILV